MVKINVEELRRDLIRYLHSRGFNVTVKVFHMGPKLLIDYAQRYNFAISPYIEE
jgi:hypothetical protein